MNRNPEVDRWLDQGDHPPDATMRRARDIILGADGRVTESIKWKTPTFAYQGNIASFNPSKRLLSVMFHRARRRPRVRHPRLVRLEIPRRSGRLIRGNLPFGRTASPVAQFGRRAVRETDVE